MHLKFRNFNIKLPFIWIPLTASLLEEILIDSLIQKCGLALANSQMPTPPSRTRGENWMEKLIGQKTDEDIAYQLLSWAE